MELWDEESTKIGAFLLVIDQLCPTRGTRATCGPGECFVRPSLSFSGSKGILHTDNLPYFDNLEFNIFDAGVSSVGHLITSVNIAIRI